MKSRRSSRKPMAAWLRPGRVLAAGALWLLSSGVGRVLGTEGDPAPSLAPPAAADTLSDLLRQLRARQLAPASEAEGKSLACQALLDAFATGGSVVGSTPDPSPPEGAPLVEVAKTINERFWYVRVGAVEAGLAAALADSRSHLATAVDGGLALDLRGSGGNDLQGAAETSALIATWQQPVVAIVNRQTRGAAEVLGRCLREEAGAVLLGQPTRGLPYPLRPVRLAGDLEVLLPEVPAQASLAPLRPDVPAVEPTARPLPPGRAGAIVMVEEERDECVRQALDLLTAICAFRQKHF